MSFYVQVRLGPGHEALGMLKRAGAGMLRRFDASADIQIIRGHRVRCAYRITHHSGHRLDNLPNALAVHINLAGEA